MRLREGREQVSEHTLDYLEFLDYHEQPGDHECHALETASLREEQRLINQAGRLFMDSAINVWKQQSKHLDLRKPREYISPGSLDSCTRSQNVPEKNLGNRVSPAFQYQPNKPPRIESIDHRKKSRLVLGRRVWKNCGD